MQAVDRQIVSMLAVRAAFTIRSRRTENAWHRLRRENQTPPPGDWRTWLVMAGRGFGKTRTGAEWVYEQIMQHGRRRMALVGATADDARAVMVEGPSGLKTVAEAHGTFVDYQPTRRRILFPNGAVAITYSAEEPKRLRGPEHDGYWADEIAAWKRPEAWDMLQFGVRIGEQPNGVATTTPKPVPLVKALLERAATPFNQQDAVVVTRGTTMDNAGNLAPAFLSEIVSAYEGTRLYRQEILGELLEDVPGALWRQAVIDEFRVREMPPFLKRIVIGVDPKTGDVGDEDNRYASKAGSETGIVAVGVDSIGHGYVLEDASLDSLPLEWAEAVANIYDRLLADRVVAEANNGGKLVESTLRTVRADLPITLVYASKGKIPRAEPIAALQQRGLLHHVGALSKLEEQLTTYDGTGDSPDRLDAYVWAATELFVEKKRGVKTGSYLAAGKEQQR